MALSAGARLGPYEIVAPLGAGGMGEVYRARDTRLHREVAVKVLPQETAESPGALARFEREACAVAALSHPNLVVLFDVGRDGPTAYAVMELLQGETLRRALSGGALPEETVLDVARQLADGLSAAHGKGVVHRDLKPENIFLTGEARVKVLDFGLAKPLPAPGEEGSRVPTQPVLTEEGIAVGTPSYMAPEQVRGGACDARTDLFAFGAVLYELLTGRRAFRGASSAETLAEILTRDPPEPEQSGPLSAALWSIARRCLRKDPEARFQSARDVSFALEAVARPGARPAAGGTRSVAVLPFKQLVPDGETAHLGLGLADATVTELAALPSLLVRPTAAILKYEGRSVDPQSVGRELGVDAVVDGSLQRAGARLRVTVQLVETSSGRSLWGGKVDASLEDVFAVQDEVSRRIVEALQLRFSADEPRRPQADGRAYGLYVQGRVHLLREDRQDVTSAIRCFREAVALDPGFAPPLAALADAYVRMAFSYEPEGDWYDRAQQACDQALARDPASPEARYARARLLWSPRGGFDVTGAMREVAACLKARPSLNEAWGRLGIMVLHVDLLEEGLEAMDRALAIDPDDPSAALHRGLGRLYQGRFEEALAITEAALPRHPSEWGHYQLALCHLALRHASDAAAAADQIEQRFPRSVLHHSLRGLVAALRGDAEGARRQIAPTVEKKELFGHYHHAQHDVARILALLGERDEAFRWLHEAAAHGLPCVRAYATDPLLEGLRGDGRFDAFLEAQREVCRPMAGLYRELFG